MFFFQKELQLAETYHRHFDVNVLFCVAVEEKQQKTLKNIMSAKSKIRQEISELNERLKQNKDAIQKFKEEIRKLDKQEEKLDL